MSCSRWIAVCVDMFEHPVVGMDKPRHALAWLWMISTAAWKPTRREVAGKVINLRRGQLIASRSYIAKKTGLSEQEVRTLLVKLSTHKMLSICNQGTNVITICNYEKYQTPQTASNQPSTSEQPGSNHTCTKDTTSTTEKNPPTPQGAGRDFWAKAINPDGEHGHDKVALVDGKLTLFNGYRAEWLAEFEGDAKSLDLALKEVAGRIQPSSHARPLEAQVSSQLARMARDKRDRDKRYAETVARNAKAAPKKPSHMARY
jgi:hypothetical protein